MADMTNADVLKCVPPQRDRYADACRQHAVDQHVVEVQRVRVAAAQAKAGVQPFRQQAGAGRRGPASTLQAQFVRLAPEQGSQLRASGTKVRTIFDSSTAPSSSGGAAPRPPRPSRRPAKRRRQSRISRSRRMERHCALTRIASASAPSRNCTSAAAPQRSSRWRAVSAVAASSPSRLIVAAIVAGEGSRGALPDGWFIGRRRRTVHYVTGASIATPCQRSRLSCSPWA